MRTSPRLRAAVAPRFTRCAGASASARAKPETRFSFPEKRLPLRVVLAQSIVHVQPFEEKLAGRCQTAGIVWIQLQLAAQLGRALGEGFDELHVGDDLVG